MFARRRREMPERNVIQAKFPRGSQVIPNPHGTAPGIDMRVASQDGAPARVFALPGVPAEMHEMWQQTLAAAVREMTGTARRYIHTHCIKCFGVGESHLESMLPDLIRRGRQPRVGITVSRATITLRIVATAATPEICQQQIDETSETIHQCLGDLVFGQETDELQDAVVRLLRQRGETLSTVEYGPGGMLAHWLNEADASGDVFQGGWILRGQQESPTSTAATPDTDLLTTSQRCRQQIATDWTLAIGPFPESDREGQEAGDLQLALIGPRESAQRSVAFGGHPDLLKHLSVKRALNLLRLKLTSP
jgi:nicotinamide-nucleotide amidase